MYFVKKEKVRNVHIGDNQYKTFNQGEDLPEDYEPPEDYITNDIVEEKKKKISGKPDIINKKDNAGGDK